jgi:methylglutaconyl-CoA hydratase
MSSPVLLVEEESGILTLRLNRPEKRNALNRELVEALQEAMAEAEANDVARVILIRGQGPDFCAGADLAELQRISSMGPESSFQDARRLGDLLLQMRRHSRPIVAAVHGRALAGGCGLATACDLVLASRSAELGYPEIHLGFVPAMVMAILRQKVGEGKAFELVALGHRISAVEAAGMGLVNRVLEDDAFASATRELVEDLARRPSESLTLTKRLLYEQADLTLEAGVQRGAEVNVEARETEACKRGVEQFLARRGKGSG